MAIIIVIIKVPVNSENMIMFSTVSAYPHTQVYSATNVCQVIRVLQDWKQQQLGIILTTSLYV